MRRGYDGHAYAGWQRSDRPPIDSSPREGSYDLRHLCASGLRATLTCDTEPRLFKMLRLDI